MKVEDIDTRTIVVENIAMWDYPDFCDAYIDHARWKDGTPLTEDELEELNIEHTDYVYEAAVKQIF